MTPSTKWCHCLAAECGWRTNESSDLCQSLIKNKIEVLPQGSDGAWKAGKKTQKHQQNKTCMKRKQDELPMTFNFSPIMHRYCTET
jgi:hypothetical protein